MSNASLRSARLYSLVILVLGYVGLSFAWEHQQRLKTLAAARLAMAQIVVASPRPWSSPTLGEIDGRTYIEEVGGSLVEKFFIRVRRPGGGEWGVAGTKPGTAHDSSEDIAALRDIAARIGIRNTQDREASDIYMQIEQRTLGTEVMVPGVGLGFQGMQVVWVCVIATFGFLVVLRDRVQHVLSDDGLAVSERWLVIDGREGIERFLSRLWLVALALTPMALSSGLVLGVATQVDADGATSTLFMDILKAAGVLALLAGNGWLSLTAVSRILELRGRRFAYKVPVVTL